MIPPLMVPNLSHPRHRANVFETSDISVWPYFCHLPSNWPPTDTEQKGGHAEPTAATKYTEIIQNYASKCKTTWSPKRAEQGLSKAMTWHVAPSVLSKTKTSSWQRLLFCIPVHCTSLNNSGDTCQFNYSNWPRKYMCTGVLQLPDGKIDRNEPQLKGEYCPWLRDLCNCMSWTISF